MKGTEMEKGFYISVEGATEVVEFDKEKSYETLKQSVAGWIERVPLPKAGLDLWVNEEGKILGLPVNPVATVLFHSEFFPREVSDYICGNVIITRSDDEGEVVGLTEAEIRRSVNSGYGIQRHRTSCPL